MSDTLFPMESNLTELAATANESHQRCEEAARTAVEHAMRAGEALAAAKELIPHGGWRDWLRENVRFSQRTAQVYLRVARELPKLPAAKAQHAALLSLREVSQMLAEPTDSRMPEPDQSIFTMPKPEPEIPARQSRGRGVQLAHEAIEHLKRIPQGDALRDRAFEIVSDYIEYNYGGEAPVLPEPDEIIPPREGFDLLMEQSIAMDAVREAFSHWPEEYRDFEVAEVLKTLLVEDFRTW